MAAGRPWLSLLDWATDALRVQGLTPARHHELLLAELDAFTRGEINRLMVLMPPGSAKSTYTLVNTDLWGAYVPTPTTRGTWYLWGEGQDGSCPTVNATAITVN